MAQVKAAPKEKPLFKDLNELKKFILWAKVEGIAALKVADIEVAFSTIAQSQGLPDVTVPIADNRTPDQKKADQDKEDADILYWSVK